MESPFADLTSFLSPLSSADMTFLLFKLNTAINTTKTQSSRQYGPGTKTEIKINGTK